MFGTSSKSSRDPTLIAGEGSSKRPGNLLIQSIKEIKGSGKTGGSTRGLTNQRSLPSIKATKATLSPRKPNKADESFETATDGSSKRFSQTEGFVSQSFKYKLSEDITATGSGGRPLILPEISSKGNTPPGELRKDRSNNQLKANSSTKSKKKTNVSTATRSYRYKVSLCR
jgi:hypothetical protein